MPSKQEQISAIESIAGKLRNAQQSIDLAKKELERWRIVLEEDESDDSA